MTGVIHVQIGVVYPQTELESDAAAIRGYGEAVDAVGYAHVLAYDHVLGADPVAHSPWVRPYDVSTPFQEVFVLFGYLAATTSLEMATGVLILPQRQTALVAKQAVQVDLLTGGRFRLGVGVGWNSVEYGALGKEFCNRGRRLDEQIVLLRRLFTEPCLTFHGEFESIDAAGLNPLPPQRPIPIWVGGRSPAAYRRMGRLADGWVPEMQPGPEFDQARSEVARAAEAAGRDPASLGMDGRVTWTGDLRQLLVDVEVWRAAGATHLSVNTMRAGLGGIDGHVSVLTRIARELGLN